MHDFGARPPEIFPISFAIEALNAVARWRPPGFAAYERLIDALCDPKRRLRSAFGVAVAYTFVWFLYAIIAKSSQGINTDMGEMIVWMREPALGYPKHPPFLVWELALWFSAFPLADWSYYLLSAVNLGGGLFAAFVLAGQWLDGEKRATTMALLATIPFYNFLGLKFDQNSALIPLWAFAIWAFVRSLDTRGAGYAVAAGLLAAACMLSKYWSVFLLLALGIAALVDRRRAAYFASAAPYVTALVAAAAFAPHAYWLVREHFPPIAWATGRRASHSLGDALRSLSEYTFGTLGYAALAVLLVLVIARPTWRALRDGLFPVENDRRAAAVIFWAPLLVPVLVALATSINLLSLWNTPALNLLPVVLLGSPLVALSRDQAASIASVPVAVALLALAASPLVALANFEAGVENDALYSRGVAAALDREWRQATDRPLKLVAGPFDLISSVAMYGGDRPSTSAWMPSDFSRPVDLPSYSSPWATNVRMRRDGVAIVCPQTYVLSDYCVDRMNALAAMLGDARRSDVVVTPRWLGFIGTPRKFIFTVVPPPQ